MNICDKFRWNTSTKYREIVSRKYMLTHHFSLFLETGMVHSVSGWTRGVQVKLWDTLRTRAIPEHLKGVFTTRRYTNPRLPNLTLLFICFLEKQHFSLFLSLHATPNRHQEALRFMAVVWRSFSLLCIPLTYFSVLEVLDDYWAIYRVAQNKIPHQTICNISTTSGPILKILEAA